MRKIFTTKKRKYIASIIVFILIVVGFWAAIPEKVTIYVHPYAKNMRVFLDGSEIVTQEFHEMLAHCYGYETDAVTLTLIKGLHHIEIDHPSLNDSGTMDFQIWLRSYVTIYFHNDSWNLDIYYQQGLCM